MNARYPKGGTISATSNQTAPDRQARGGNHQYLTEKEASKLLRISTNTLRNWRWKGGGPPFVKIGRSILYDSTDLKAFVDGSKHYSTSEYGA